MIPDISRSPFPIATSDRNAPQSLLFVPMMAQGEVIGVMELDQDDRMRDFSADEQALAQHLGNQIGAALRLLAQRTVQAQLFRTEKMAAVGRLISGVVNELQTPLRSITELADLALERESLDAAERDLRAISSEAQKASGIVARLVSYAAAEQSEARPVSVGALLRTLIEFREGDWKASGIRLTEAISREPLNVLGSQGQLEQVFLNLLVHAEQAMAEAPRKTISIRTSLLAKRLLVEISFSAAPEASKPEEAASILGVTRSVVAGHGGEVRLIEKSNADPRFEVDLPLLPVRAGAMAPRAGVSAARGGGAHDGAGDRAGRGRATAIDRAAFSPRVPRGAAQQLRQWTRSGAAHAVRRGAVFGACAGIELGGAFGADALAGGRVRAALGRLRFRAGCGFRRRRQVCAGETDSGK